MEVREIKDKDIWEGFLSECAEKTFLQSWNWGEFQKEMRGKIWRLGIYEGNELIGVALVVKVAAKRGTFLLVPHGPVGSPKVTEVLVENLKRIAREERIVFIRINPIWEGNEGNRAIFKRFGFSDAPIQMHPETSWKLDLRPSEDELLQNMRKTTRYLIRQAQKNPDITLRKSTEIEDVKLFAEMHQKVSLRQKFVPFSLEYLTNEFSAFSKDGQALLLLSEYKGEIVAAAFVLYWSGIGFYHHAASFPQFSKLSIPYLLQWEAIKEAKSRGCRLYDFWGYVNPFELPHHPWAGSTLFKMGFGGEAYEYVKTQDLPLKPAYWFTFLFEKIRKVYRGL